MNQLLYLLAALACPLSMGLMMLLMRGKRGADRERPTGAPEAPGAGAGPVGNPEEAGRDQVGASTGDR